ncbi:hypothetical protein EDC30_10764 [Paucimonas lemoignei]|uniref:HEAT repeat domain-containing protein n=1 Tax=Paucimonas lemoignei TaxID=29443 RepID=A0A4R3HSY0_PAULE|nr:hypothetical protein [Paucimonas lemoignei]TCS36247.1 hypothetical protein EDC30_10764 [Paucimonas lemoignei]
MRKFLVMLLATIVLMPATAATLDEDVARYIQIFNSDTHAHQEAVESLAWMGLSDTRLFDVIERRVKDEADRFRNNKDEKNRVARYIRALGFSGQSKYEPTIRQYLADRTYERYAKTALEDMDDYRKWNPIISNRASFDPRYSDDVNRVMNMLKSDDPLLKRVAAKRIYFAHQDDVLLELLAKDLKAAYPKADTTYSDATSWMVKALGNAKNPKYRPLIQEIAGNSRDSKVASYAKKALESF